jgi:septal ring factor EnvC (AmiA/AmiB activator)
MSELILTQIESSLVVLDEKETSLIELRNEYSGLKINGLDDKEGYLKVREGRLKCKNTRVQIEKDASALRDPFVKFQKAVIKRENELIAIIEPIERALKQEEDSFNELRERIRQEEERKENDRIQSRINALLQFNYGLSVIDAKVMTDEEYTALLARVEEEYNQEQQRLAELKAEEERKRKEEEERLRLEREEFDRQRAEFAKREAELKAIREKELAEQRQREAEMKAEQQKKEAELRSEREKLEAEKREIAHQKALREAEERAKIEAEQRIKREAEAKAEAERIAKEKAEREELLKPDKQKLIDFADNLERLSFPDLQHLESQDVLSWAHVELINISTAIKERAKSL